MVEDDARLAETLANYFIGAGYQMSRARTSRVRKALAERPDLILTDLNLPDAHGVEVITNSERLLLLVTFPLLSLLPPA